VDDRDRLLLDELQNDLPLVERPFAVVAQRTGLTEPDVLDRVQRLRSEGVIRQLSAIFDTRRLGYASQLVAARSRPGTRDAAAAVFSSHPGVTHNYRRDHAFDLWFTIAVAPDSRLGMDASVEILGRLANVESIRPLPALRFFKIGVDLDMSGGRDPAAKRARRRPPRPAPDPATLTEDDRDAVRALQTDLPAVSEPFAEVADRHGRSVQQLLDAGRAMLETGQMRRFAAVLNHRTAGFVQNGMGVWIVDEDRVADMGAVMAGFRGVSHCYQRPVYDDWPYRLFSMTHGRTKQECEAVLAAISEETGLTQYAVLYSTFEYKKTRLRYFTPEQAAWEDAHAALVGASST
jgi:siroheme decarboxylase